MEDLLVGLTLNGETLVTNAAQSPISTLPPELLSLVFQHACITPDFINRRHGVLDLPSSPLPRQKKRAQFILGAVSPYWRQILQSTPHIWTSVDLVVSSKTAKKALAILRAYFTHSANLPLAIGLHYRLFPWHSTTTLADASFDAELRENAHRIQELFLGDAPDLWIDLLPSFPNLNNLYMSDGSRDVRAMIIEGQCSRLTIRLLTNHIHFRCPKLTVLHLDDIPIEYCLEFLLKYPNLVEYKVRGPGDSQVRGLDPVTLPSDTFILPHLEVFEWPVAVGEPTGTALFQHARMPALRELIWAEDGPPEPGATDTRHIFFQNLPDTLTHLHIHTAKYEIRRSTSVFDLIPGNLKVKCITISRSGVGFLDHVFERLTPSRGVHESREMINLPNLKSIVIRECLDTEIDQARILEMLERRFLRAGVASRGPFLLEFGFKLLWLPKTQERLKNLIGRGLKIEIREYSKPVDWL